MGETMTQQGSNPSTIKIISNKKITRGVMENIPSIVMGQMRIKLLGLRIGKNVAIPRVIGRYGEQVLIQKIVIQW
jgi:hypothetical protein